jgi:hypothetical protein
MRWERITVLPSALGNWVMHKLRPGVEEKECHRESIDKTYCRMDSRSRRHRCLLRGIYATRFRVIDDGLPISVVQQSGGSSATMVRKTCRRSTERSGAMDLTSCLNSPAIRSDTQWTSCYRSLPLSLDSDNAKQSERVCSARHYDLVASNF